MNQEKRALFQAHPSRLEKSIEKKRVHPFVLAIFGGAGDLSQRKLIPALYHLYADGLLPEEFALLGIGRTDYSDDAYRRLIKQSLKEFIPELIQEKKVDRFCAHCAYQTGDSQADDLYKALCGRIHELSGDIPMTVLFYLAVPPKLLSPIVHGLRKFRLCEKLAQSKIVIEKPFGRDQDSAHALNSMLRDALDESQIFRIDHYLGKETVQNILFFRFGNSMFEPLWNYKYIDHVQITVAEDLGIGHRGDFYEQTGVVRDLVQNHILQLLALVAMEPPAGFDGDLIRDEKVKVYRSIRPVSDETISSAMVRGQYGAGMAGGRKVRGYRDEKGVEQNSNTPTFFAGKFYIDNWRWAGVPFYIRTGKRLPSRLSEIYIQFLNPPHKLFGESAQSVAAGGLVLAIQPDEEIVMRFNVKYPGMGNLPYPVDMVLNYRDVFHADSRPAYERLLIDAIKGDPTLFARMDGVEAMWGIVDPVIKWWDNYPAEDFPNYAAGSWGPEEARFLLERDGRQWRI